MIWVTKRLEYVLIVVIWLIYPMWLVITSLKYPRLTTSRGLLIWWSWLRMISTKRQFWAWMNKATKSTVLVSGPIWWHASDNQLWVVYTKWWSWMSRPGLNWVRMWARWQCLAGRMRIVCTARVVSRWLICYNRRMKRHHRWRRRFCVDIRLRSRNARMSFLRKWRNYTGCAGRMGRYVAHCPISRISGRGLKLLWRRSGLISNEIWILHLLKYVFFSIKFNCFKFLTLFCVAGSRKWQFVQLFTRSMVKERTNWRIILDKYKNNESTHANHKNNFNNSKTRQKKLNK